MYKKLLPIFVFLTTSSACGAQPSAHTISQVSATSTSSADAVEMKTYTSADGRMKFDYPGDWTKATDYYVGGPAGQTASLLQDAHGAKCKLETTSARKTPERPDKQSILRLATGFPKKDSDVLKEEFLNVDGNEVYERIYKFQRWPMPQCPVETSCNFVILKGDTAYILALKCRYDAYDHYLPVFERMGKSFRVLQTETSK